MDVASVKSFFGRLLGRKTGANDSTEAPTLDEDAFKCCSGQVHIAYRGVSDDRLYLAYNRKINEIKFFKPNGLRVFCADCRRRIV